MDMFDGNIMEIQWIGHIFSEFISGKSWRTYPSGISWE
jgi:hypothetical protein